MNKTTNLTVVEAFYRKYENDYTNKNMSTTHGKLYSYNTCIAEWKGRTLLINETYYSNTTRKHLSILKKFIKDKDETYHLYNVPYNIIKLNHLINREND